MGHERRGEGGREFCNRSSTRFVMLFKSRSRPLEQHDRTVAKTNLHLNVLITNPIADLIFKTMGSIYLRRVWPVEVV